MKSHRQDVLIRNYDSAVLYPGVKQFDCGNRIINAFARNSLKKAVNEGNCAAKVLIKKESSHFIGLCTYTGYSLMKERLMGIFSGSLPAELAVIRLVMLGVSVNEQNKGFGQSLLHAFFEQVKQVHALLPLKGVFLDAEPAAIPFYARLGFVELPKSSHEMRTVPMFLAIQHIVAA